MRVIKVLTAGWLLVLGIIGCQREFPQATILISPQDGAVFTDQAPVFVWQSVEEATEYIIRISKDSFTDGVVLVEDTLEDTTYTMTDNIFQQLSTGSYEWAVAPLPVEDELLWSEVWSFSVDKSSPPSPILIAPEDGAVFDLEPPEFIWRSVSLAKAYIILLHGENLPYGDTIVVDTLEDTTYALPWEVFEGCYNGNYKWCVASLATTNQAFWSNERSLSFNQPAPQLDLDTTYFPFGLEYKWIYEEYGDYYDLYGSGEWYDTITIRVVDSTFVSNGWSFDLEGWSQQGFETVTFLDVDNPARIVGNQILIFGSRKIFLTPEPIKEVKSEGGKTFTFEISYKGDTLRLLDKMEEFWDPIGGHDIVTSVSRVKGIGVISQSHSDWSGGSVWYGYTYWHNLLYFIKGEDTVWTSD